LLPDGILRVGQGLGKTLEHGVRRTVPREPPSRSFDDQEVDALAASGSRNLWVAAEEIASANLRARIITGRLKLWLKDSDTVKFLWLRADRADVALRAALGSWGVEAQLVRPENANGTKIPRIRTALRERSSIPASLARSAASSGAATEFP